MTIFICSLLCQGSRYDLDAQIGMARMENNILFNLLPVDSKTYKSYLYRSLNRSIYSQLFRKYPCLLLHAIIFFLSAVNFSKVYYCPHIV